MLPKLPKQACETRWLSNLYLLSSVRDLLDFLVANMDKGCDVFESKARFLNIHRPELQTLIDFLSCLEEPLKVLQVCFLYIFQILIIYTLERERSHHPNGRSNLPSS